MGKPLEGEEAHRGQVLMAAKAQQQIAHQMGQLSVTEAIARGKKKRRKQKSSNTVCLDLGCFQWIHRRMRILSGAQGVCNHTVQTQLASKLP